MTEHKLRASLTVEAALAFPLFFYALITLCGLFINMEVCNTVKKCMVNTAREISVYGDAGEVSGILQISESEEFAEKLLGEVKDGFVIRTLLETKLSEFPFVYKVIKGGAAGISCLGSQLITDDGYVIIRCGYSLLPPVSLFSLGTVPVEQEIRYRYFTGYEVALLLEDSETGGEPETEEETVYVTENGKVYHSSLTCPALNLKISEVVAEAIGAKRNESGGKYYACEKCADGNMPEVLYITEDGDRYHFDLKCSGLKRTIREIRKSEIEDFRECKRCHKKE